VTRKLLWPTVMTAVMFVILLGLGTWQVRRLSWKEAILAQIAQAEAAPPIPLPPTPGTTIPPPFTKVAVTGTLMHDRSALYAAEERDMRTGPEMGAYLIEPLQRKDAPPVLVERGWVPLKPVAPVSMPQGDVTIAGYVHAPSTAGLFSATDDVPGRHFYTLDPHAIGTALGLDHVAPFILIALAPPPTVAPPTGPPATEASAPRMQTAAPAELPIPEQQLPRPPNNHLAYAVTWYGLAAALLVIFIAWARKAAHA
jgi:surfeit locus 1 family protein